MRQELFLSLVLSLPGRLSASVIPNCPILIQKAGFDWARFPGVVAHGTHSMTLEDLRQFKPDVSQVNGVPVVNPDLLSPSPILLHAPAVSNGTPIFITSAMQVVDRVLSHMDDPFYDISGYSTLERLVHGLHMQEIWKTIEREYKSFEISPPAVGVCECMTDVDNNGVMKMLRFIALKVREPQLMYDHRTVDVNGHRYTWDGNIYKFNYYDTANADELFERTQKEQEFLPLTNEKGWTTWRKVMSTKTIPQVDPGDNSLLAAYLFCSLQK